MCDYFRLVCYGVKSETLHGANCDIITFLHFNLTGFSDFMFMDFSMKMCYGPVAMSMNDKF